MPRIIELEQGSPDWLAYRTKGIGGSDANLIAAFFLGIDYPYGNSWAGAQIYKLWAEKVGRIAVKESKDNSWGDYVDPKTHGKNTEAAAREWWSLETGEFAPPAFLVHDTCDHIFASLDGYVDPVETGQIGRALEVKCPKEPGEHRKAKEGQVPERYYAQVQHNLVVSNVPVLDFVSFYQGEGIIIPVQRDEKFIDQLREAEETFWGWVQNKEFPLPKGETKRTDKEWAHAMGDWFGLVELRRDFEAKERMLRRKIMRLMDGGKVSGGGAKVSISVRGKQQVKAFEKDEFLSLVIQHE